MGRAGIPLVNDRKRLGLRDQLRKMQPISRRCGEMADATDLKSVGP